MFIDMEMPFAAGLKTDNRSVFTVIGTVGLYNANVVQSVILRILAQCLADLFATVFFAFITRADIKDPGWRIFRFAHAVEGRYNNNG